MNVSSHAPALVRRVVLLARTLGLGGMERMTVNLSNALARQGHEVHLVVFKDRIALKPEPGVHLHVVDLERVFRLTLVGAVWEFLSRLVVRAVVPNAKHVFHSFYFSRLFRLWLWSFERRYGGVDLIVARGYGTFHGLAGIVDPRFVRVVVNEQWEQAADVWSRRFFRGSFHGAKVVFNSRQIEATFLDLCRAMDVQPALTRVLPNPTDIDRILRDADATPPVDGPYIVAVGRLERAKNHQLLLSAFALIADRIPHRLVLVGKGGLLQPLRQQAESLGIAERVVFAGQQHNPYPWIRHAQLFVLPSLHEGLPNVVIEAFVCGTPVVVTRGGGGTVELMQEGLADFIAEMEPVSLAAKMLDGLKRRPCLAPEARAVFSMDSVAKEYLALACRTGVAL